MYIVGGATIITVGNISVYSGIGLTSGLLTPCLGYNNSAGFSFGVFDGSSYNSASSVAKENYSEYIVNKNINEVRCYYTGDWLSYSQPYNMAYIYNNVNAMSAPQNNGSNSNIINDVVANNNSSGEGGLYNTLVKADFISTVPVGYSLWASEKSFLDFSTQTLKYGQRINGKIFTAAELTAQYQGMMSAFAKGANVLGQGSFIVGSAISVGQFYLQPTFTNGVGAAGDISYGAAFAYAGVPGWIAGAYYYGIKYTIGWDTMIGASYNATMITNKVNENQSWWGQHVPGYLKR